MWTHKGLQICSLRKRGRALKTGDQELAMGEDSQRTQLRDFLNTHFFKTQYDPLMLDAYLS